MKIYDWSKEKVSEAVKNNYCYLDVLRDLNIPTRGRNADTLKNKIKEYNLDISHFTFVSKNKGKTKRKSVQELLIKGSHVKTVFLKNKLLEAGLKENKCEICGLTEWQGKPLVCQLHHIDGDETNNCLDNLQMLCPNCHSQTENYCGSANIKPKQKFYCENCGREIKTKMAKLCVACAAKQRTNLLLDKNNKEFPTKEELENLIKTKTFVEIGKIYGITDNAVRRWCDKYNLPRTKTELGLIDMSKLTEKECLNCHKTFKPTSRKQCYCSNNCKKEFLHKYGDFKNPLVDLSNIVTKDELIKLHENLSWKDIAEKFNTTRNHINQYRKQIGLL